MARSRRKASGAGKAAGKSVIIDAIPANVALSTADLVLVRSLFAHCAHVKLEHLGGGLSGAMVLKASSLQPQRPGRATVCVLKIGQARYMHEEATRALRACELLDPTRCAAVVNGPIFAHADGEAYSAATGSSSSIVEEATPSGANAVAATSFSGKGAVAFEYVGASADTPLIATLKRWMLSGDEAAVTRLRTGLWPLLWGAPAVLSCAYVRSATRRPELDGVAFARWSLRKATANLCIAFFAPLLDPDGCAPLPTDAPSKPSRALTRCFRRLVASGLLDLRAMAEDIFSGKLARMWRASLAHDTTDEPLRLSEEESAPLVAALELLLAISGDDDGESGVDASACAWLRAWRPVRAFQHGDLNAANMLTDGGDSLVRLIDFAKAGETWPHVDAAKMLCVLLLELHRVPLCVRELQTSSAKQLQQTLYLTYPEAERLKEIVELATTAGAAGGTSGGTSSGTSGGASRSSGASGGASGGPGGSASAEEEEEEEEEEEGALLARLVALLEGEGSLRRVTHRVSTAKEANAAMAEACELIEHLLGSGSSAAAGGGSDGGLFGGGQAAPLEMHDMRRREPLPHWSSEAQQTLRSVVAVVSLASDAVEACARECEAGGEGSGGHGRWREQQPGTTVNAEATAGDRHVASLLVPLFHVALAHVRYVQLCHRQKRLAWHLTIEVSKVLAATLRCAPDAKLEAAMAALEC